MPEATAGHNRSRFARLVASSRYQYVCSNIGFLGGSAETLEGELGKHRRCVPGWPGLTRCRRIL